VVAWDKSSSWLDITGNSEWNCGEAGTPVWMIPLED